MSLVLHGYWRSGASHRVRIALNLKGLAYEQVAVDLRAGDQRGAAFRGLNPQGLVPALVTPEGVLSQSPAILEWLEETHPEPPLLPADAWARARVRAVAAVAACDVQPLNNLRVLNHLRERLSASEDQIAAWTRRWIGEAFAALEPMVDRAGGPWACGDRPTLADCCLVPQVYSAERFGVDLAPFPRLRAAAAHARAHPAVAAAAPERQPDADPG